MTIPADVLRAADRLAREWGRSRSWVITEAIRRLGASPPPALPGVSLVADVSATTAYGADAVAAGRRAHLEANLALTPAERLARAESLVRLARAVHPRPRRSQVIAFDSLEDFAQWKKARRAGA